jgi:hypothetical protein
MWRILKSYFFWTYERGSFHYDVMVSLILAFIFIAPRYVNFKDQPQPVEQTQHSNELVVTANGDQGSVWQADAAAVDAQDVDMVRINFQRLLRPIAGPVTVEKIEQVRDAHGQVVAYRAWVRK